MATVSRPHTYPEGTTARAAHANENEVILYNLVNGNIDWDNLKAALVNAANGLLKLDASGNVPLAKIPLLSLAKIPTPLTGKDADLWDGHHYGDTYNIDSDKELQHNSVVIVNTSGKVLHAVYG